MFAYIIVDKSHDLRRRAAHTGPVVDHDIVDKGAHVARTAALGAIDIVAYIVDWVGTVVVFKAQVEIPYRSGIDLVVVALLIHIHTPVGIGIAR